MINMNDARKIYDTDENPLSYMIEPKGEIEIVDKDVETKPEDFKSVLK